jgi:hypothetical protein
MRVAVEMWVKVFSPNTQSVEIVQRSEKKVRRARLTYMRYVFSPDFFNLEETPLANNILPPGNPNMTWAVWTILSLNTSAGKPR